jgi:hypothetical protein
MGGAGLSSIIASVRKGPGVVAVLAAGWLVLTLPAPAFGRDWFVAIGGAGNGTAQSPFGSVQAAVDAAQPGDTVRVRAGTYTESVTTVRSGSAGAPITLRGETSGGLVLVTTRGTVLQIDHSFIVVEQMIFDAAYAPRSVVEIGTGTQSVVLRGVQVRRSGRDCVDIGAAVNVLIEDSLIHRCLNSAGGRTDAHGIVAGAVQGLTIRGTEIHSFSGDAIQLNRTGTRHAPGWNDVLIERCRLWLAPLADTENGFRAGTVPGENALDTKVAPQSPRARITIRDTQAWGFTNGMINLQAAFNLKENIDATVDRVTVWDSTIAFRLRGSNAGDSGAWVRIQNAVVYGVEVGIRYEDSIRRLRVWNTTFGRNVALPFDEELAGRSNPDVRNVVFLQAALPAEATGGPNLAVNHEAFVNAADDDYRLASHSPLIDAGTTIQDVTTDRAGLGRPQGRAYDIGAFELLKTEN